MRLLRAGEVIVNWDRVVSSPYNAETNELLLVTKDIQSVAYNVQTGERQYRYNAHRVAGPDAEALLQWLRAHAVNGESRVSPPEAAAPLNLVALGIANFHFNADNVSAYAWDATNQALIIVTAGLQMIRHNAQRNEDFYIYDSINAVGTEAATLWDWLGRQVMNP